MAAKLRPQLNKAVRDVVVAAEQALRAADGAARAVEHAASGVAGSAIADLLADMRAQLGGSLAPGFITRTGAAALPDLTRQLQALQVRAERVVVAPARDRERLAEVTAITADVERAIDCAAGRTLGGSRRDGRSPAGRRVPGGAVRAADADGGAGVGQADTRGDRRPAALIADRGSPGDRYPAPSW